jgi:N-acetylmuramoyl-L-alanine amidase
MAYFTIVLDAGHGGWDNGAVHEGRAEKDDNLALTLAVGNILQNAGVNVVYTRTQDIYETPYRKAQEANLSGADYFISIHRNSSPYPNTYSGVESLVYSDEGIASIIARNINRQLSYLGFRNIGVSERPNLIVLNSTQMPAVLVEVGFINTDADNALFDLEFDAIAEAIAYGILESIGVV